MAFELNTDFFIGAGSSLATAMAGGMAFMRYWTSSKASNANDKAQVDMLERQSKEIDSKEAENKSLREEIKQRDETIRKYWAEISDTRSTLKIIQASQQHLEQQNALLKEQVKELTASNMELLKQMTELRESLRVPR